MTYRHHLLIDSIVQAIMIIFFGFLLARSLAPVNMLQLMPIMLFGWQFINAVLSYKFFERMSKKLFVRIAGVCLIIVFAFRGLLWMAASFGPISEMVTNLTIQSEPILFLVLTFLSAAMAVWYLYLTFKDLYNMMYNTI